MTILWFITYPSAAQEVTSDGGRFKVDFARGCTPHQVNVTNLFGGFGEIQYTFEPGFPQTRDTFHIYNNPGIYEIVQFGARVGLNELRDTIKLVEIFDPILPDFTVSACANNAAKVLITDTYYDRFRIFYTPTDSFEVDQGDEAPSFTYPGPGTYDVSVEGLFANARENCGFRTIPFSTGNDTIAPAQIISAEVATVSKTDGSVLLNYSTTAGTVYRVERTNPNRTGPFIEVGLVQDPNSTTLTGLNTEDFYYCFRIVAFDACSGQSFSSDTVCSSILNATPLEGSIDLSWKTNLINFSSYQLFKDSTLLETITSPSGTTYSDQDLPCNQELCYSLRTTYSNGITTSVNNVCATAISGSDPPVINNITASYEETAIELSWEKASLNSNEQYQLYRSLGRGEVEFLDSTDQNDYLDLDIRADRSYCYQISYRDECGNQSKLSNHSCPVRLRRSSQLLTLLELSWSNYQGWQDGVGEYIIEELDAQGNAITSMGIGTSRSFEDSVDQTDSQIRYFRVRAESSAAGAFVSFSNLLEIKLESQVFLPTAFAPGGLNNRFQVNTYFVTEYQMRIFNRWGEIIHFSDQSGAGWDGTIGSSGKIAPVGPYIYRIDFKDQANNNLHQSGRVVLIR